MLKYILRRLFAGLLTIVVLITVAFFMMHAMPGSPFNPSEEKNVPPEVLQRLAASYGLDRPVGEQYLDYWKQLLHGNLGISYVKAIRAPISHVKLLAVGGVNEDNVADFLHAGMVGAGVGGNLANKKWIEAGEYDKITQTARKLLDAVKNA